MRIIRQNPYDFLEEEGKVEGQAADRTEKIEEES
jgi:hypothetical protein